MEKQGKARPYKFPFVLANIMRKHPLTGGPTTQKALAEAVGIRPQTISLYVNGETQPNAETLLKIADYFSVSVDYLLTGVSAEKIGMHEYTGLTEESIEMLHRMYKNDKDAKTKLGFMLDSFLSDVSFYEFLEEVHFKAEFLTKLRGMSYIEHEEQYPGIDMLGYTEWSFINEVQDFITDNMRKRGLLDGKYR